MSCYRGNLHGIAHRITFQKISSTSEGVLYSNVHKGVGPSPPYRVRIGRRKRVRISSFCHVLQRERFNVINLTCFHADLRIRRLGVRIPQGAPSQKKRKLGRHLIPFVYSLCKGG